LSKKTDGRQNNPGRPEKPIDWNKVDQLLMSGCTGPQIAPHFDISPKTLYEKVFDKFNVNFTQYSALKKEQGISLLLAKQFEKAMKGDNTMLIWVGKQLAGQRDLKEDFTFQQKATYQVNYKNDNSNNNIEVSPTNLSNKDTTSS
jgi:hypothetical protein